MEDKGRKPSTLIRNQEAFALYQLCLELKGGLCFTIDLFSIVTMKIWAADSKCANPGSKQSQSWLERLSSHAVLMSSSKLQMELWFIKKCLRREEGKAKAADALGII